MRFKNNPGNIRHSPTNKWIGETQPSLGFCQFSEPFYGVRSILVLLLSYRKKYGLNSPISIISRYAPPSENDTEKYVDYVASKVGKHPTEPLNSYVDYVRAIMAICQMETGIEGYTMAASVFNCSSENARLRKLFHTLIS